MSEAKLEQRVESLEKQIAVLQQVVANGTKRKDWRSTVGMFAGDELMMQIDEEARKIREADRRRAKRGSASRRQVRK